jgi:WD40 repeat protein
MPTATLRFTLRGHGSQVRAVAFSPDGLLLASGSENKRVRLQDSRTGQLSHELTGHAGAVRALAFSPDGAVLAERCFARAFDSRCRCLPVSVQH